MLHTIRAVAEYTPRRRRMARARAAHAGPARVRRALRRDRLRVSQKVMVLAPEQAGTRCGAGTARETSPGARGEPRVASGVFSIKRNVLPRTLKAAAAHRRGGGRGRVSLARSASLRPRPAPAGRGGGGGGGSDHQDGGRENGMGRCYGLVDGAENPSFLVPFV
jgi:hypothetical protein